MSRLRAWCAGASLGYVVGWLAGSNVLKMAEGRRLGREGHGKPMRWVDLFGIDPDYPDDTDEGIE